MGKKIVLICSPSHALRGGVESIVNDLSVELPKRGWEALLGLGKGARFNDVDKYRTTYTGLPIIELDGTAGTRQGRADSLDRVIRKVCPDVILSARIYDTYGAVARLRAQHAKTRLAITIQAYEPQYIDDARRNKSVIDLCIASGNMIREAVIRCSGVSPERVVSIPGGVMPPEAPVKARTLGKCLRIGYVGRLQHSDKRVLDMLPLVSELERVGVPYHRVS